MAMKTNRDILGALRREGITITDLAAHMKVNRSVLSMRLNQKDRPDPEFRDAILQAIKELKA